MTPAAKAPADLRGSGLSGPRELAAPARMAVYFDAVHNACRRVRESRGESAPLSDFSFRDEPAHVRH
jgi:hypothetical protein